MTTKLLDIAQLALREASRLGADQAEAYVASTRSFTIEVENNSIKTALEQRDMGTGIRCVIDRRIGFAYVTTHEKKDVLEAVEQAVSLAKSSIPDPHFVSLPSFNGDYPQVTVIYDPQIAKLSADSSVDIISRAVDAAKSTLEGRKYAIEAELSIATRSRAIVNSLGIECTMNSTFASIACSPALKSDNEQTSSFDYQISRRLSLLNPEQVGVSSAESAIRNLGAKTIEGGDLPVLLDPFASSSLLGFGFAGAINAEEVQYGRSYISDALGSEIASESLSIVDDGLLKDGIGSRPFDAEGYLSQRTQVLSSGVLMSLLHNSYTAQKDSVDNTGNAGRPSYAGLPSISTSNFIVLPGHGDQDALIAEIKRGVLCRITGDHPNMTTGDLSAMILEGSYIENGSIKHPLKNTLIGINMRDLLRRVVRVGADTRVTGAAVTPSILIESARVTSG